MIVYIEYALLENFLIDGGLLLLSRAFLKREISYLRIFLSALLGALFALTFPFLNLPLTAKYLLKFAVGGLLVLLASKEKSVGRYAVNVLCFFMLAFAFAGFLFAVNDLFQETTQTISISGLLGGSVIFAFFGVEFTKSLYAKRKITPFLYRCELCLGDTTLKVKGFLDSGNTACFQGVPVCFLSGKLLLELIKEGQVCDEMQIATVGGIKKIKIFQIDELRIYSSDRLNIIEKVYVSPTGALNGGEYQLLLNGGLLP